MYGIRKQCVNNASKKKNASVYTSSRMGVIYEFASGVCCDIFICERICVTGLPIEPIYAETPYLFAFIETSRQKF